jgi:Mannosyl-glycoprotein endo-beta-N-acetylglucosaminidase
MPASRSRTPSTTRSKSRNRTYKSPRRPSSRKRKRRIRLTLLLISSVIAIALVGFMIAGWLSSLYPSNLSSSFEGFPLPPPRVIHHSQTYPVRGRPSISADFINQVLAAYQSPAAGKGQALYNDGLQYGIDPAYALAFFMHESSFGTTGVATVTLSLGNIRATPGYPQYSGYRRYKTWEDGFADWYRLIAKQYVAQWGLSTVDTIIPVYAPSSDHNDVTTYIQAVKNSVDTWRSGYVVV